jgi:hypothetical protein
MHSPLRQIFRIALAALEEDERRRELESLLDDEQMREILIRTGWAPPSTGGLESDANTQVSSGLDESGGSGRGLQRTITSSEARGAAERRQLAQ